MPKHHTKAELRQMIHDKWGAKRNPFDESVQDCIEQLSDDRVDSGIDALKEIAVKCKTGGMTKKAFISLCLYIEKEAIKLSDEAFVQMKIRGALQNSRGIIH